MDYKIVHKPEFTVVGVSAVFKYDHADTEIPKFWTEFAQSGKHSLINSMYGISIDKEMGSNEFEYLIADQYDPSQEIPTGFVTRVIPEHTWAVFLCKGALTDTQSLPKIHQNIFSEWLPQNKDYELAAGYHIEMYSDPSDYEKGVEDENYYSEIWIPVRKIR